MAGNSDIEYNVTYNSSQGTTQMDYAIIDLGVVTNTGDSTNSINIHVYRTHICVVPEVRRIKILHRAHVHIFSYHFLDFYLTYNKSVHVHACTDAVILFNDVFNEIKTR